MHAHGMNGVQIHIDEICDGGSTARNLFFPCRTIIRGGCCATDIVIFSTCVLSKRFGSSFLRPSRSCAAFSEFDASQTRICIFGGAFCRFSALDSP